MIGVLPYGIFIDGINNVYTPSRASNFVLIWSQWGVLSKNISGNLTSSFSVYVSITGNVYIDNGYSNGRVDQILFNTSTTVAVMRVNGSCYGLFIDVNNYLYCSMRDYHQVMKILLNNGTTIPTVAAGNGSAGSAPNMLNSPQGIYVDGNLNLYVADCGNNRIQVFQSNQFNGVTVAGNGASGTISLACPTGVVLDTDGYLFIVDSNNHRIVGAGWNGFRCIVGCSGGGSTVAQLAFPQSMAFDSYGNIFVTDRNNSRIQKFTLQKANCCKLFFLCNDVCHYYWRREYIFNSITTNLFLFSNTDYHSNYDRSYDNCCSDYFSSIHKYRFDYCSSNHKCRSDNCSSNHKCRSNYYSSSHKCRSDYCSSIHKCRSGYCSSIHNCCSDYFRSIHKYRFDYCSSNHKCRSDYCSSIHKCRSDYCSSNHKCRSNYYSSSHKCRSDYCSSIHKCRSDYCSSNHKCR